ncbi:MAG TPA: hypothetical protein VNY77_09460 [Candidatus Angelobacter sp.]|jgi:hypothetical protein|nr:hypothetical protein [Candidatus Angelobacter sp.]
MARLGSNGPFWPNTHVQPEVLKSHIFEVRTAPPVSDGVAPGLSVASATGRLVGRDHPLAALREALQRAVKGEPQIV